MGGVGLLVESPRGSAPQCFARGRAVPIGGALSGRLVERTGGENQRTWSAVHGRTTIVLGFGVLAADDKGRQVV